MNFKSQISNEENIPNNINALFGANRQKISKIRNVVHGYCKKVKDYPLFVLVMRVV